MVDLHAIEFERRPREDSEGSGPADVLGNGGSAHAPTPREMQVVRLLAAGKSNKEVAAALTLSTRTVETYRARLMCKLKLRSAADIVRYAIRHNLVEP